MFMKRGEKLRVRVLRGDAPTGTHLASLVRFATGVERSSFGELNGSVAVSSSPLSSLSISRSNSTSTSSGVVAAL